MSKMLDDICRLYIHVNVVLIPKYTLDPVRFNQESGISFLQGSITEQEFKTQLQRVDKRIQHAQETRNVLEMTSTTINDMVNRYHQTLMACSHAFQADPLVVLAAPYAILSEINPLLEYANGCLSKIARVYGSKSPVVLILDVAQNYYPRERRVHRR
jgi:predicted glycosyltransferase